MADFKNMIMSFAKVQPQGQKGNAAGHKLAKKGTSSSNRGCDLSFFGKKDQIKHIGSPDPGHLFQKQDGSWQSGFLFGIEEVVYA